MPAIKRVRVSLIERDPHYRLFLEGNLSASPRHRLIHSAATAAEVYAWPSLPEPNIVLIEIEGLGEEATPLVDLLRSRYPNALPLVLTSRDDETTILQSIRAGAVGYVLKQSGKDAIFDSIDNVLAGGSPLSPRIAREVIRLLRQNSHPSAPPFETDPALPELSPREAQILTLVAQGASDKKIGEELLLARSTIKNAMLSIYGKWRVRTRTEAAIKFIRTQG